MKHLFLLCAFVLLFLGCKTKNYTPVNPDKQSVHALANITPGKWTFHLKLPGKPDLDFGYIFNEDGSGEIVNAKESIKVNDVRITDDSIFILTPIFNSAFKGKVISPSLIEGKWYNYAKGNDYTIDFSAELGGERSPCMQKSIGSPSPFDGGKWEVTFSEGTKDSSKAIGVFNDVNGVLTGTFMTEMGDFRFLEGKRCNESITLSCFDGAHAFLFTAKENADGTLSGTFYSGHHWQDTWVAKKNPHFELTDPYDLTFIKEGFSDFSFSFLDLDSNMVSFPSDIYNDKVTIVQLLGSWCPNCVDETRLLADMHKQYKGQGLEVISLCFERPTDFRLACENVKRLKSHFDADFKFLIAGPANKRSANDALPMLNHVMSFPTSIFIDRQGKVRKIHTGFYGPSTGDYYTQTVKGFHSEVVSLLNE